MAKIVERRRVNCPVRHVVAFISEFDDGSFNVTCGLLKHCGDGCPYLNEPRYQSPFRRAPAYGHEK